MPARSKYDVTPKILEAHAGMVTITIKGTFPSNILIKNYFDSNTCS
ncbi:MAG: hypothetical protein IPJ37_17815 [Bacteroidales bacterium]|nr:hypothetical protein [Bacteroidales bacterium]